MRSEGSSQMLTRRALLRGCAALLVAGEGLVAPGAHADSLRVGAAAPPATLVTLDGERIATTDLGGEVVILTFWATWCVPCRDELPLLSRYAERHATAGLRVLGFSLDTPDRRADVRAIASTLKFPVGLLVDSTAAGYGRIWRLPVSFVIGRDGRLIDNGWQHKNAVWTESRLDEVVTPLLAAR
jgi:cytochrome c biogenesis protein CcmG/thiol:disulfide interchange protein DsbE